MINNKKVIEKTKLPIIKIAVGLGVIFLMLIYPGWVRSMLQNHNMDAKRQAELSFVIANGSKKTPKYGSSGHYLTVPDFSKYDK